MEFDNAIKKRASIRIYSSKKPDIELVIEAIEAANTAPSPSNMQILRYIVVEEAEKIKQIADACQQPFIEQSQILVVVCSDSKNALRMYDKRAKKYVTQHAGAAIENMLLKITDLGLASCWIGAFSEFIVKNTLKIPDDIEIEAIFPIGYQPKSDHTTQKKKYQLDNRLFFNIYNNKYRIPHAKVRRGDV